MSERELGILVVAKDFASKTIGKVGRQISGLEKAGARAKRGLGFVSIGLGAATAAAGAFLGANVRSGIDSLVELENATSQVDGAIAQLGLTGKVTSGQIAGWANDIESSVQAAFDDKAIVAGAANLIRFGKVSEDNLRPAMVVMTDLAAKTGSVESASTLLGKALADPAKAAGKLTKAGVSLTAQQQKQIGKMVKAGDVAGAQAVVLRALEKQTKGAAEAAKGPFADAQNTLADVTEDAQKALAVGFLPVLTEVSDFLRTEMAKPETLESIREIGTGLAGGLKSIIATARSLPWAKIADALRAGAGFAGDIIGAFMGAPDWLKAAVIGGWGLNKVSGGLVGELGKGLIKGVLGLTAGVVNIKAGTVVGGGGGGKGGGLPGGGLLPGAGAAAGGIGAATAGAALGVGFAAAFGPLLALMGIEDAAGQKNRDRVGKGGRAAVVNSVTNGSGVVPKKLENLTVTMKNGFAVQVATMKNGFVTNRQANDQVKGAVGDLNAATGMNLARVASAARDTSAAVGTNTSVLRGKRFDPKIVVPVSVSTTFSIRSVTAGQRVTARYNKATGRGSNDGSRNLDWP